MEHHSPQPHAAIAVVGCGAAGLFAAIWAARTLRGAGPSDGLATSDAAPVVGLDGASSLGAKILVAGGGRCNVTHHAVDEFQYAGSSRNAIRNVLRRFDVPEVVRFFEERGVVLKREETGKLFPTSDDARTILDALLDAARDAGVLLRHPARVRAITRGDGFFAIDIEGDSSPLLARRVILCTGGRSLPKTGSDGAGYELARALGHTITPNIFPALVPLTLPRGHFLTALSGITVDATLVLRGSGGRVLKEFTNSTLLTHVGLSGPSVLDMSRYFTAATLGVDAEAGRSIEPGASLAINWSPGQTIEAIDGALREAPRRGDGAMLVARWMQTWRQPGLPERLARALCEQVGVGPAATMATLSREHRRALATILTAMPLPITGDRGYLFAEATAGGVPLDQLHLRTLESRVCHGLHVCGEVCDVDGRVGGFNFQWAWASGYVAGIGAAGAIAGASTPPSTLDA